MKEPSAAVSKTFEDKRDYKAWASGKGAHVPAHNDGDAEYVQTKS